MLALLNMLFIFGHRITNYLISLRVVTKTQFFRKAIHRTNKNKHT